MGGSGCSRALSRSFGAWGPAAIITGSVRPGADLASGRQSELSTNDFVSALSKQNFCYQKEYKKFIDYANSVNGEKKRREIEAALKKEKDEIAGSKTKKGGPKKKRKPKKK